MHCHILAAIAASVMAALGSAAQQPMGQDLDLVSITHPSLVNSEEWNHAIAIIDKAKNAPSCHRRSLAGLIESCQSIDTQDNHEVHGELTDVKKVFAARLAVCELDGAKVDSTSLRSCDNLVLRQDDSVSWHDWLPLARRRSRKPEHGPRIDNVQLKKCLEALHSNPQSWTSYSNSLAVTLSICHASRFEIEKDQMLETYRTHTFAIGNQSDLVLRQQEFVEKALGLQKEVHEELRKMTQDLANMKAQMDALTGDLVRYGQDVQTTFVEVMRGIKEGVNDVETSLRHIKAGVTDVGTGVNDILDAARDRNTELAKVHSAELQIFKTEAGEAAVALSGLEVDVVSLKQLVALMVGEVLDGGEEVRQNMGDWRKDAKDHSADLQAHKAELEASTKIVAELNNGLKMFWDFLPSIAGVWSAIKGLVGLLFVLAVTHFLGIKSGAALMLFFSGLYLWEPVSRRAMEHANGTIKYFSAPPPTFNMMMEGLPYAIITISITGFVWIICHVLHAYRRSRRSIMDDEAEDMDDNDLEKTHAAYY